MTAATAWGQIRAKLAHSHLTGRNTLSASKAPGLARRQRRDGTIACYWVAAKVSRNASDYHTKTVRLYGDEETVEARCRALTDELNEWLTNGAATAPLFDGTVHSLIDCYQRDEDSPYRQVRPNTQASYDYNLGILKAAYGERRIDALTRKDFTRWHRDLAAPVDEESAPRVRRAHGAMTMARMLMGFGTSMRFEGCRDARDILDEMRFPTPKRREQRITFEQAAAVVNKALEDRSARSIALGQALQFELGLRQIDVVGQWAPAVGGTGGIVYRGRAWTGGITWNDLSAPRLAKRTSKTGQEGVWNPADYPLLVKAMAAFEEDERVGPAIIDERTGQPYKPKEYGKRWRPVATAAGVPRNVWNMDSRAGALTEADEAGATPEDMRQFATHASFSTTQRYIRNTEESTARIAALRVAHRQKRERTP